MDSITKRRLVHNEKVSVEGNEDRISNLPRSLIGYILSFLPTKNAVATSVLSTKWKYRWTSITTLDFDDGLVVVPTNPSKDYKRRKSLVFYRFPLPKFDHLTYLELGYHRTVQWKMLLDFVQSSPRLETLIFGGLAKEGNQTTSRWYQLEHIPSCLLFHLKIIEIKQFSADSHELKMAEYFLNNSRVLEKLIIHPVCLPDWGKLEICEKVLMLPRRSRTCRVEVLPEMDDEDEDDIFVPDP
ncbi:putative FBD-associated F-box protein At3g50710 isoform X2 [Cornus florida]|uniref:putative FBD-associated F-box protein At3g50710 isoform X2 n=1 Tax=Cornus florida TaxID=4283 RepID=UPI00289D6143|nr:putative FBD-associated F-box protein At3g50710 isoform X2 [Cornus florida]